MANLTNIAFIGTTFLHGWHGRLSNLQNIVDDYARIGQIGSGAQIVGRRSAKCQVTPWAGAASRVEAIALADAFDSYQGTTVRVGDDLGRVFQRVRVESISTMIKAGYGGSLPTGVQMLYKIEVTAVLEVLP